jgi:hypothetical protein
MNVRRSGTALVFAIFSLVLAFNCPAVGGGRAGLAQFCWIVGTYDRAVYFAEAEEREDREGSFIEMLTISGMEFSGARCVTQKIELHRVMRDRLMRQWRHRELEIVNTTFLSDLDY